MTNDFGEFFTQSTSRDSKRFNASNQVNHTSRTRGEALSQRARNFVARIPSDLERQVARHPYRVVGIALAVGLGVGVVIGSRIWRAALVSAASIAVLELGRSYFRREVERESAKLRATPPRPS